VTRQYVSFYLDEAHLGVDVLKVQELLPPQVMTPVPRAPGDIRGLINLRGQIVPAVDLRRRLGLADHTGQEAPMNVVVRAEDGLVSFLVDRIGDVVEVPEDSFEPAPDNVESQAARYTAGVHKLPDHLLVVLDVDQLCGLPS